MEGKRIRLGFRSNVARLVPVYLAQKRRFPPKFYRFYHDLLQVARLDLRPRSLYLEPELEVPLVPMCQDLLPQR